MRDEAAGRVRGARLLTALLCGLLSLGAAAGCSTAPMAADDQAQQQLPAVPVTITTSDGRRLVYRAEVARTAEEQARGLMFRQHMDRDAGMIFPFAPPRRASFWMANTLIPLDMIFIRTDGVIESIAAGTKPKSLTPVESQGPVAAVLELNGGEAARAGIKAGDRVDWRGR